MNGMHIPALGKLIVECWKTAERKLRENVSEKYPDRDEEPITTLFHAELEVEFKRVSASGAVERAFLSDLKRSFPNVRDDSLLGIARGLIATVSFHPREVERKTGGDLGVVLVRPDVQEAPISESAALYSCLQYLLSGDLEILVFIYASPP